MPSVRVYLGAKRGEYLTPGFLVARLSEWGGTKHGEPLAANMVRLARAPLTWKMAPTAAAPVFDSEGIRGEQQVPGRMYSPVRSCVDLFSPVPLCWLVGLTRRRVGGS